MEKAKVESTSVKVVDKVTEEIMNASVDAFTKEDKQIYRRMILGINADMNKVEKAYLSIALKLYRVYVGKLFEIDNYQTIYDFAKDKFSLGRGTCNNYINICQCFGCFDIDSYECIGLLPEYKDFSSSKLILMLSMPQELQKQMKPEMTVSEMKELKRLYTDDSKCIETEPNSVKSDESEVKPTSNSKDVELKSVELVAVDDVLTMTEEQKDLILDSLEQFKENYPNKVYSFSVYLNWEE